MAFTSSRRFAAVAAATVALAGSLLTATPALAAPPQPYGTVISPSGVVERELPSTSAARLGALPYRAEVGLRCKVHGQRVDGNDLWYQLRDRVRGHVAWVAARYVRNTGTVPFCPSRPRLTWREMTSVEQGPLG
ncbi:SH3 domain-containing protein [Streptomyces sp. PTM05]|uniref:SH3 domain-containing protein n=1 Tax=Streptantibioticus parmotrematis TaxID=2873249 RepID=A0ABS7QX85_9ACTN|nr:SH3 domain-containing protein [Streptantibioticus parmotrematis]MBY8887812.1 SH3 domain-containing protein [Streptantibioticus parmotrematis]